MSAAVSLPPAPTAMALRADGFEFERNRERGNRIASMNGTADQRAATKAEVTRRASIMVAMLEKITERPAPLLVICSPAPTGRTGVCISCGDPRPGHLGGQCELCEVALGRALRATGRL